MVRNCCVISKQHVPDENLANFCLGSESGEDEGPEFYLIGYEDRSIMLLCWKHVLAAEQIKPQRALSHGPAQPFLTPLWGSNGSHELPLHCTVPFGSAWKHSTVLCSQLIFGITKEVRPSTLTRANALVRSMKAKHLLFSALLFRNHTVTSGRHVPPASGGGSV